MIMSVSESFSKKRQRAQKLSKALRQAFPGAKPSLNYTSPFQLLVATILSAQCTDVRVNMITPKLFAKFPTPQSIAAAEPAQIEELIHSAGFFRQKAKSIQGCAKMLLECFNGQLPESFEALTSFPGVGRKTANCVRVHAFHLPGLTVDTHFQRIMHRLQLTSAKDPDTIELEIGKLLPEKEWSEFACAVITLGRKVCEARNPKCHQCPISPFCPSSKL